jgi:glycosyltransferase involved in cell wall biosynthesis
MKVIYSIGSKFGGHGIGAQAVHAARGIYRARALKKVLASYQSRNSKLKTQNLHGVPKRYIKTMGIVGKGLRRLAYYDPTGWGYVLHDNVFDRWAASQLEPCDIFHGWNHHCLQQLRRVGKVGGVGRTVRVVERASSHVLQGQEILHTSFWPKSYVEKCLKEYEEADFVVVPSEYAFQSFVDRGFDPSKVIKIPFGVDHNKFKVQSSKFKTVVQNSKFIVLYVGEVRLGKGVPYLLEAWRKLQLKDAELWLVGEVKGDFDYL